MGARRERMVTSASVRRGLLRRVAAAEQVEAIRVQGMRRPRLSLGAGERVATLLDASRQLIGGGETNGLSGDGDR